MLADEQTLIVQFAIRRRFHLTEFEAFVLNFNFSKSIGLQPLADQTLNTSIAASPLR
jgi:hypothetical protein